MGFVQGLRTVINSLRDKMFVVNLSPSLFSYFILCITQTTEDDIGLQGRVNGSKAISKDAAKFL